MADSMDFVCDTCGIDASKAEENKTDYVLYNSACDNCEKSAKEAKDYTLYSTGCSKCKILEAKMTGKQLSFDISNDVNTIMEKGFMSAPVLHIKEGDRYMNFADAVKYVNAL